MAVLLDEELVFHEPEHEADQHGGASGTTYSEEADVVALRRATTTTGVCGAP